MREYVSKEVRSPERGWRKQLAQMNEAYDK